MTDRQNREEVVAGMLEADRLIIKSKRINRALLITVLLIGALLAGWNWPTPADAAAKRNVYKGTVTVCYAPSKASDEFGQYLQQKWVDQLPAAVKAAKPTIGNVRIVKERYPLTTCGGAVRFASTSEPYANNPKRPYSPYLYGERGVMWESHVTMGDKVGAKLTPAQRQAWLIAALKTAIPR